MINAVGIDVSKGKSTVAILQPGGIVIRTPFNVGHSIGELNEFKSYIQSLEGETRVVLECTGRYHEPILRTLSDSGVFVSAVNPHLIKNFKNNSVRKVKSDPVDAKKIARYTLDNWAELHEYSSMEATREQLKTLNAQLDFFTRQRANAKINLISLLDMTYPGINDLFSSPARDDGSEKWVDYAASFWHVDCVRKNGLKSFKERYKAFCKGKGYKYSDTRAKEIFDASRETVSIFPKERVYKDLIEMSIKQLRMLTENTVALKNKMNELASTLPEYPVVMSMSGVGKTLGPQLIAEIGDVTRFTHREAITAFAGVDPGVDESGNRIQKSNRASKCGPPRLRKALFLVMSSLIQTKPDDAVYHFIEKKRSEGKRYHVYMTAGANKFLRIYYGKVKAYLASQSSAQ